MSPASDPPTPDPSSADQPTLARSRTTGAEAGTENAPTTPDPVRDVRSDDDRDVGWGDDLAGDDGGRDSRWYEEQRPPHWE